MPWSLSACLNETTRRLEASMIEHNGANAHYRSSFGFGNSFVIRHSSFVDSELAEITKHPPSLS
jgi:hypothetical protein